MPDLSTVTFTVIGFIIALGVWLLVSANSKTDGANSDAGSSGVGYLNQRGNMQPTDWFNAAINMVAGALLGIVLAGLGQHLTTSFWLVAILTPILFGGFLLFDRLFNGLIDKIFPSGIRAARKPLVKRRTPLPRQLSLPVGLVLGVALAWLGLSDRLLGMI